MNPISLIDDSVFSETTSDRVENSLSSSVTAAVGDREISGGDGMVIAVCCCCCCSVLLLLMMLLLCVVKPFSESNTCAVGA